MGWSHPLFNDDLYTDLPERLRMDSTGLDRAVLLRQVLRRWSVRDRRDVGVEILVKWRTWRFQSPIQVMPWRHVEGRNLGARVAAPLDGVPDAAPRRDRGAGSNRPAPGRSSLRRARASRRIERLDNALRRCRVTFEGSTLIAMLPTGSVIRDCFASPIASRPDSRSSSFSLALAY